jgi:hypothetical protein
MMLTLLVYSYSMGFRSSRKIEQLCERDIAFRVICGNLRPDHSSIARFRQRYEKAFGELFLQVLKLCREAKLTKAGIIAVDGTKVNGNTSLAANRTEATLTEEVQKILSEAKARDAEEDRRLGTARGDELPEDLRKPGDRQARIDECLRQIKARETTEKAKEEERQQRRREKEKTGKKVRGRKPKVDTKAKPPKANVTDPESRIMKTGKGFLQGFNAQAVANEYQIIVAAEVTQDQNDQKQFHPMINLAVKNLKSVGEKAAPKIALADAGYTSEEVLSISPAVGVEPIMATRKSSDERILNTPAPRGRIPKSASARDRMARKTRTKRGKALYKLRGQIIEPIFGQIKSGAQKLDRFSRRGTEACDSEWKLICAVHNLGKLWKTKTKREKGKKRTTD